MTAPPGGWSTDEDGHARLTGHLHFAFEDPLSSLPETARNLLVAAKEIVADEGFEALTLKAVSERAGENKAMVSYYFDNKAGLVAAVLDSVIHDEYLASLDRMKDVAPEERIPRLVEEMRRMAASADDFTVFFELLPHVLRDDVLRRRMVMLIRWYWKMKLEWLGIRHNKPAVQQAYLAIQAAVDAALADANARTGDLGGKGNTKSFADTVVRHLRNPKLQAVAAG